MDLDEIRELATAVQDKSDTVFHLAAVIDDALDNIGDLDDTSDAGFTARHEAIDRIALFVRLIKQTASEASQLGERIEMTIPIPRPVREGGGATKR